MQRAYAAPTYTNIGTYYSAPGHFEAAPTFTGIGDFKDEHPYLFWGAVAAAAFFVWKKMF